MLIDKNPPMQKLLDKRGSAVVLSKTFATQQNPGQSIQPYTNNNLGYDSSFNQAETIVRNLNYPDEESVVEIEQAMVELER